MGDCKYIFKCQNYTQRLLHVVTHQSLCATFFSFLNTDFLVIVTDFFLFSRTPNIEDNIPITQHRNTSMEMSSTSVLPVVGFGSMARTAGLLEIAVRLCLNQRKQLCPHVWVPILKPQRSCIRPPASEHLSSDILSQVFPPHPSSPFLNDLDDGDDDVLFPIKSKRVVFADSRGLSLTAVRVFSDKEEQSDLDLLPSLQSLGSMTEDGYSCTVSTCCPGTQLKLGFPQPSANFQAFRAKLAESMVILENCSISEKALRGTVRVKNVSYQKDVRVRITFDSWQSYRDVPCTYLQKRFGGPQTDIFEFDITIPKVLDAKRKIEFCLSYLPGGHSEPFWDNNDGQNYSITVSVNSHLCHGKNLSERS
ncbi:protein phosphatase 1 regulatory subunit 3C-B-like isoform X1 [Maylandia zebra]|uniref:protein phosphatase 1 regulatory subunit 3C-B-like isoform X1 n=1 Tax=Maylandia zebra TaxID=106582 RepID=UPI000329C3AF